MFLPLLLEAPGKLTKLVAATGGGFHEVDHQRIEEEEDEEEANSAEEFEEAEAWNEEDEDAETEPLTPNCLDAACLASTSDDLSDLSARWKKDFSKRPTWFDAGLALRQILRGKATGFRAPLYSRVLIQRTLFRAGCFVQRHAWLVIVTVLSLFALCSMGLRYVHIETDIVKLWVQEGGRLNEELKFLELVQQQYRINNNLNSTSNDPPDDAADAAYNARNFEPEDPDPRLQQIPEDEAPTSSYQVLIQTASAPHRNVLSRPELLKHVGLMEEITRLRVHKFGLDWSLDDICFKPGSLDIQNDSMAYALKPTLERLIPCIWISPVDCFFEGAKPLGPHPPIDTRHIPMGALLRLLMPDIPEQASWANIDPQRIIGQVTDSFDLGTVENFFTRSGIGHGYLHRPCIDPLDPACPPSAPNYYANACQALRHLEETVLPMKRNPTDDTDAGGNNVNMTTMTLEQLLAPFMDNSAEEKDEQNEKKSATSALDILGAFFGPSSSAKSSKQSGQVTGKKPNKCAQLRAPFLRWMSANWETPAMMADFEPTLLPKFPDYGHVMEHGCHGVAKNVMSWPADMILGGLSKQNREEAEDEEEAEEEEKEEKMTGNGTTTSTKSMSKKSNRKSNDVVVRAEALQSVILVATPTEVFRRFKDSQKFAAHENASFATSVDGWSPLAAREVIQEWARAFTRSLYNHALNTESIDGERRVHPLASNSISDMLAEFCDFNYAIIAAGYVLMLLYALYSQCRFDGCCSLGVESAVGLALAGVLTVTMSSVAGLGVSTWLGINFNAATTQIVPFLALGIGVDNMFLLLHNYPQVVMNVPRDELGFLMKETGMSILTTSLNNILAFWAGTILPIPALRSFCGQTAILLTANLVGIFLVYPAFIALDLKRRKAGRRDMAFLGYYCLCLDESVGTVAGGGGEAGTTEPGRKDYQMHTRNSSHVKLIDRRSHYDEEDPPYLLANKKEKSPEIVVLGGHRRQSKRGDFVEEGENGRRKMMKKSGRSKRRKTNRDGKEYKWYTLEGFLHIVYLPLLDHRSAKIGILLCMLGFFLLGCIGITRSSIGLELSDVLPEHSAPAAFLKTRDRFFSFYPMSIVLRGDHINFPAQQHQIDLLRNEIGRSRYVIKLPGGEPSERYWLQLFRAWLRGMQQRLDEAQRQGLLDGGEEAFDSVNGTAAKSPDLQIAYSLACSYGQNYDCARAGRVRLIDDSGTINADGFYNYLYGWHEYEQMFYAVSQASFYPRLRKLRQGPPGRMKYRYFIPPAPKPLFSRIPFYLTGLRDTPTIVDMIREIRAISERYTAQGLPNHPEGVAFTFWEQYLELKHHLVLAIAIISVSVFLVISLIIFNPWAAAMVTLVVLSMAVELAGFMGWAGVKLNPISAVTLITAVGIGVEFTAHVVLAFLTSLGNRHQRMRQCLEHMFVPVIHGGVSTLLGIMMLAFSQFDFVFKYFFVVMSALVIVGMLNGLALLPVLLSLVGPPCEVRPVGGPGHVLPCPPSIGRRRSRFYADATGQQMSQPQQQQPIRSSVVL